MKSTKDYVAEVRARLVSEGINPSKYRVGKVLKVAPETVGNWDSGKTMDDESAIKMAVYLGYSPGELLIAMAHERARTPEARTTWERVARSVGAGTAVALALAVAYALAPDQWTTAALALPALPAGGTLYIMLNLGSVVFAIISVSYLYLSRARSTLRH